MSDPVEKVEKKEGAGAVEHINLKVVGSVSKKKKKNPLSLVLQFFNYAKNKIRESNLWEIRIPMKSFSKSSVLLNSES